MKIKLDENLGKGALVILREAGYEAERPNETIKVLQEKETKVIEWQDKMFIAKTYAKIKQYDQAWRLFHEVILMKPKFRDSCYAVYIEMAKISEAEGKYKNALFDYLLAYRRNIRLEVAKPSKNLVQNISKCLKKLGLKNINFDDIFKIVRENSDINYLKEWFAKLFK